MNFTPILSTVGNLDNRSRLLSSVPADFEVAMPAGNSAFEQLDGLIWVATEMGNFGTPLRATVTALGDSSLACQIDLVNLGPQPTANQIRFYLFDSITGTPLENVRLVVDLAGIGTPGEDNGWGGEGGITDQDGMAISQELATAASFSVSAFLPGYDYLSLVGLPADLTEVVIPLQRRAAQRPVGGFYGRLAFEAYEARFLGGQPRPLRVGLVGASFPLSALFDFDLQPLLGRPAGGCGTPEQVGRCYDIEIAGVVMPGVPFDDGLVVGLDSQDWKPFFDVTGAPGRRHAWSLGGELMPDDLAAFLSDYAAGGLGIVSLGDRLRPLTPSLHNLASGVMGMVPMPAVDRQTWQELIALDYQARHLAVGTELFARLDGNSATLPPLSLTTMLDNVTQIDLARLPPDPTLATPDRTLDGLVVLTGARSPGSGLALLGIGVGLDCSVGSCDDRLQHLCADQQPCDPSGPTCGDGSQCVAAFDGVINGQQLCAYSTVEADNECSPSLLDLVPSGHLGDGSMAVFTAPQHSGMEVGEAITVTMALSLHNPPNEPMRGTARVSRETLERGRVTLQADDFLAVPTLDSPVGRSFAPAGSGEHDLQRIIFTSEANDWGEESPTRWTVYVNGAAGQQFTAPLPKDAAGNDLPDPLTPSPDSTPDDPGESIPAGHLGIQQTNIDLLPGVGLPDLAAANGTTLQNLSETVEAFSSNGGNVPAL